MVGRISCWKAGMELDGGACGSGHLPCHFCSSLRFECQLRHLRFLLMVTGAQTVKSSLLVRPLGLSIILSKILLGGECSLCRERHTGSVSEGSFIMAYLNYQTADSSIIEVLILECSWAKFVTRRSNMRSHALPLKM